VVRGHRMERAEHEPEVVGARETARHPFLVARDAGRARQLAGELWRLVRLADARCADVQSRGVEQDGPVPCVESRYDADDDTVVLTITNLGKLASRITVSNAYGNDHPVSSLLRPG